MPELVHLTVGGGVGDGVATITLDSPRNRNALSRQLRAELLAAVGDALADDGVRVLVLTHTGPVFCSGMDLKEAGGAAASDQGIQEFPALIEALWHSPKPCIARLAGPARAGGIGLVAACDIAVAADTVDFAFTEVRLGVVPVVISVPVLPRVLPRAAQELFLTGEVFGAARAREIGLLTAVVDPAGLDEEVARYARMLALGGPLALAATKKLLTADTAPDLGRALASASALSATFFASAEGQEGIAARAAKRPAAWVPREVSGPAPAPLASYSSGESGTPLLGDTIGDNLDRTVARHGGREALVDVAGGRRWTYSELRREVDALAHGLLSAGVGKGDRVGIWAPNCPEWLFLQYATAKIGAILVTINPAYRTSELSFVLNQAGVRLLVAATSFKSSDYPAMIEEVRPECPALQRVLIIGDDAWESFAVPGGDRAELAAAQAALSPDEPINLQYTSGTTGFPKGATLSHHNILNNGFFVGELCGYTEADRICVPVPLYHCFGMVMGNLAATSHGACLVYPGPGFDPAATLAAVAGERCTSLYGVPTMFIAELALESFATYDLSSLRTGIMAGSPCPVAIMKQVIDRMGMMQVSICYGMTETSPVSLQTRVDDSLDRRVSTVGTVGPHLEIKVIDPVGGLTVPRGTAGELCTRGYSVMLGYWEQPAATAAAIDPARWMHTGDLAVMDEEGYVSVTGRIKDVIIRGGENVYPREVEEFLYTHPDILDAQVVGVPDERLGEEIVAWVRLRPGAPELTAEHVREFCAGRLAHYKTPRFVHVAQEFPMTVTGKVRKVEMREESARLLGRSN